MQHLGLLSIILYWAYVLGIIARDRKNPAVPISDYMLSGVRRYLYILIAAVSFTLFYLFCIYWLLPEYNLATYVYVLMTVAYVTQLITTFTVRIGRTKQLVHDMAARISGIVAFLLLPIVAFSGEVTTTEKYILLAIYAVLTGFGWHLRRVNRPNYLPLQLGLFGSYYAAIMYLTYFS